jgi:hypothetical protein
VRRLSPPHESCRRAAAPAPQVDAAFALAAAPGLVAAACAKGIVRLFAARSLEHRGTLPRLLPVGCTWDEETDDESVFPDAVGASFSRDGKVLSVVYRDRSVAFWDVTKPAAVRAGRRGRGNTRRGT